MAEESLAAFITAEYDKSTCSTDWLKSGADWTAGLATSLAPIFNFAVNPLDNNNGCFSSGGGESAILGMQAQSCCWVDGLGNTSGGVPSWVALDLSLRKESYLSASSWICSAGSWPCNDLGYTIATNDCWDASCKVSRAEMYVR
jgi:hypothetical protein